MLRKKNRLVKTNRLRTGLMMVYIGEWGHQETRLIEINFQ